MAAKNKSKTLIGPLFLIAFGAVFLILLASYVRTSTTNTSSQAADYNPQINPADFSANITNPYNTWPVGLELNYKCITPECTETMVVNVTNKTRKIMGVVTRKIRDRVYDDGELVEDTRDYVAQHRNGDVWYFGEIVDNYENGQVVNHNGSWMAGVNGGKPGIWFKANPKKGEQYRQEYLKGIAEDWAKILSIKANVNVPFKNFRNNDCVKTLEWPGTDPSAKEQKFNCPNVLGSIGVFVKEIELDSGNETELVSVQTKSDKGADSDTMDTFVPIAP